MYLTRDQVFQEWRGRRKGKIPEINVQPTPDKCYQGHITLNGRVVGKGRLLPNRNHARKSVKFWRVWWMAKVLYPGHRIYLKEKSHEQI